MTVASPQPFVCATHGHCFDGLASAVVLRRVVEAELGPVELRLRACGYGSKQQRPSDEMFKDARGAIVDYRYGCLDALDFYFDHHPTAFANDDEQAHFERKRERSPDRFVFDPSVSSCTKLIATIGRERYGIDYSDLQDLIDWADRIDSADFESAAAATDTNEPVLRVATVTEQFGDDDFLMAAARLLESGGLEHLARSKLVAERFRAIAPRQARFVERVQGRGTQTGRVAFVDLTEQQVGAVTKFIQYRLWPDSTYSVMVALMASGVRISVGHNPWSGHDLDTDISRICARFGGGGHPMVGGIGLPRESIERAREIAAEIVRELNGAN